MLSVITLFLQGKNMGIDTYNWRTAQCIESLHPEFAEKVMLWLVKCETVGHHIYIYCGYRSPEEQQKIYNEQKKMGKWLTSAKWGQSFHNYGQAIDYAFIIKAHRKVEVCWTGSLYKITNKIAVECGMRQITKEQCHLENATYKSWRNLPPFTPKSEEK